MRRSFLFAALAATTLCIPVIAQQMPTEAPGKKDATRVTAGTYQVDGAHTQVMWRVNHLGFNDYFGLFGNATGTLKLDPAKPASAEVEIEIPLSSLATNSPELNQHLASADFFEVNKFPTARFRSTRVVVQGDEARIEGMLTLKGVTKPVVLDAEFTGAGIGPMNRKETVGFEAEATIRRSDFGISYGIPMVPDEVELQISVAFEKG